MADYDVFNGDADGICALQQLRLSEPRDARLVTGVKRDINLLARVNGGKGDRVTALDISLDKNRQGLERLLTDGARVRYFDHHFCGDIPDHPGLDAHIDLTPDRGTSFLVDAWLGGTARGWAVVGTFGDNFDQTAALLAASLELPDTDIQRLRELGILINYNGYGSVVEDLHFPPDELYRKLAPYADPLAFIDSDQAFSALRDGYASDMASVSALNPVFEDNTHGLYLLPAEPWARRVSGVFANQLAQTHRARAHAILTQLENGGFLVSVRAPLDRPDGADELCRRFPTGGGRKAAAGVNHLPEDEFERFRSAFLEAF